MNQSQDQCNPLVTFYPLPVTGVLPTGRYLAFEAEYDADCTKLTGATLAIAKETASYNGYPDINAAVCGKTKYFGNFRLAHSS